MQTDQSRATITLADGAGHTFSFQSGLLFYSLAIFRLTGIVLGLQGSLVCGGLGGQHGGAFSSLTSFCNRLGGLPLGGTGIASHADCTASRTMRTCAAGSGRFAPVAAPHDKRRGRNWGHAAVGANRFGARG